MNDIGYYLIESTSDDIIECRFKKDLAPKHFTCNIHIPNECVYEDMLLTHVVDSNLSGEAPHALFERFKSDTVKESWISHDNVKVFALAVQYNEVELFITGKGKVKPEEVVYCIYNKTGFVFDTKTLKPGVYLIEYINGKREPIVIHPDVRKLRFTYGTFVHKQEETDLELQLKVMTIVDFFNNVKTIEFISETKRWIAG